MLRFGIIGVWLRCGVGTIAHNWVLLPTWRGMGGLYWRRCPVSVARRGFLAIVAGAVEPPDLHGSAAVDLFCSERAPAVIGPRADDLAQKLQPMVEAWDRVGVGRGVLVVPMTLHSEATAIVAGRDIYVVSDPYCSPGKVYLYPASSWQSRRG